jgi:hypothetical protein
MAATTASTFLVPDARPLLATALLPQLLPLSFSEQLDAVRNIFNICSFRHTQPTNETLHKHGVEIREHLNRHRDLSRLLWDHA